MKKLLSLVLMLVFSLALMAQESTTRDAKRMLIHKTDGTMMVLPVDEVEEVTFAEVSDGNYLDMTVVDATASTIKVDCQKNATCSKYAVMAFWPQMDHRITIEEALRKIANGEAQMKTESGIVTLGGLQTGEAYTIVALAYDEYGIPCATYERDANTTNEEAFTISVDDVTWKDAHVVITPKDPTMKYYFSTMRMEKVNEELDGDIDNIPDFDYAWWEFVATTAGVDLNYCIQNDLCSGTQDFRSSELESGAIFMWGSQGIVYCYGVNEDGERITPMSYVIIDTKGPEPSDMTFDVEILGEYPRTVHATITPSTDETFYLTAQKKTYVDYYMTAGEVDKMCFQLIKEDTEQRGFWNGVVNVDESLFPALTANKEYCLVMFGFKDGRTTDVKVVNFNTLKTGTAAQYQFQYYFLNEAGTDVDSSCMTKVEDGIYNYTVASGQEVLNTWKSLTGIDVANAGDTYSYSYDSNDSVKLKFSITGSRTPDEDGVYATMTVNNPQYDFIRKIYFVK